jgi:hypothetical protein
LTDLMELAPMIVMWGAVVVLGGLLTFYALKAYRRTHERSMLFLGSGFVLLSAVTAGAWWTIYFTSDNLFMAEVGCTGLMASGFGAILMGLRTRIA